MNNIRLGIVIPDFYGPRPKLDPSGSWGPRPKKKKSCFFFRALNEQKEKEKFRQSKEKEKFPAESGFSPHITLGTGLEQASTSFLFLLGGFQILIVY